MSISKSIGCGRSVKAHAISVPHEVLRLADTGSLFVLNHSGGKDSQAMLIEVSKVIPREQIVVVHASLGKVEWEGAQELAEKQAADLGVPFIVARARKTLFEMVERRFENRPEVPSWPSSSTRQCTSDLKRGPIQREVRRFAKERGFLEIVNCLGLRAEESPGRAKKREFRRDERTSNSVLTWYEWLPIHEYKTPEIFSTIAAAGQEPHPAYALGNERLSCVFCIMGSANDIKNGARLYPDLKDEYVNLERKTGYTMHMSRRSLDEIVARPTPGGKP